MTIDTTLMASSTSSLASGVPMRFGALTFVSTGPVESLVGATFPRLVRDAADSVLARSGRDSTFAPLSPIRVAADRFFTAISTLLPRILGPTPTQEHFRDVTFSVANVVLQLAGQESLSCTDFVAAYAKTYPDGQPGLHVPLSDELEMGDHQGLDMALGSLSLADRDPARECFMCQTPDGHVQDVNEDGNPVHVHVETHAEHSDAGRHAPPPEPRPNRVDARLEELDEFQRGIQGEKAELLAQKGERTRARFHDAHRCIIDDNEELPPAFGRASQNLAAASLLLRRYPKPETPKAKRVHRRL